MPKTKSKVKTRVQSKVQAATTELILQEPRGMHDILPGEMPLWEKFEKEAKEIAEFYNFNKIETPILENAELFSRGIGQGTDIVEKEMFVLRTKGGMKLALRPEMTAPVIRSFNSHGLHKSPQPQKLYYLGPAFRHESPQAGRYRQFHQLGFEIISGDGDVNPVYDAQSIIVTYRFLEEMKIKNLNIQVNSIGCRSCRANYRRKLLEHYKGEEICRDCEERLGINPLRVLDCKNKICQPVKSSAPGILDYLCSLCGNHFRQVLEFLDEVKLPYTLNPQLVRGLDYYNRTVFEIFGEEGGLAVAGGGRYDYLSEMLGGRQAAAVGVSIGAERIIEILKSKYETPAPKPKVFLVYVGELAKRKSLSLVEELRREKISLYEALGKNSLAAQLEAAGRLKSPLALIFGQKESHEDNIIIRDMETGVQEVVPLSKISDEVKRRLHS